MKRLLKIKLFGIIYVILGGYMWSTVAMWGGVAGLFVSIISVIILFLTRKNIMDILDKDVILFERNFDIKKNAIEKSYKLIDEIQLRGQQITSNYDFIERAKSCYNELLCVVSDIAVANEFYDIAIAGSPSDEKRLNSYKISCRKDIGLKTKATKSKQKSSSRQDEDNNSFVDKPSTTNSTQSYSNANTSFTSQQRPTASTQTRPTATTTTQRPAQAPTARPVASQTSSAPQQKTTTTTSTTKTTPPKTTK